MKLARCRDLLVATLGPVKALCIAWLSKLITRRLTQHVLEGTTELLLDTEKYWRHLLAPQGLA